MAARTGRTDGSDATAQIEIQPPEPGEPAEIWDVREAWWAQSFKPSNTSTVLGWAVRAFSAHICSTIQNVLVRNLLRAFGVCVPQQNEGEGVWTVPVSGHYIYYLLDAIGWFVITLGYLLVYLAGVILIVPLYVFVLLPGSIFWPSQIAGVQRALVNFFSGGIGEQQATTNRHVAVATAASTVTRALQPFLDPDSCTANGAIYDTVTIVAHSGGCVVSFEALAGDDVKAWCAATGQRITWLTLGSGLNLGWRLRARHKARDLAFWNRRIDGHVNWINIYARYDPVPQGEPPAAMVQALTGAAPGPWLRVRVANEDWPLTDHTTYWDNREEVIARIVHAVSYSLLGRERIERVDGLHDPHNVIDRAAADVAEHETAQHRRDVTIRRTERLGGGAVLALLLLLFHERVRALGAALVSGIGWSWPRQGVLHRLAENLPHRIGELRIADLSYWALGAVLLVYLAIALTLIAGLVQAFISWQQPERDMPEPLSPDIGSRARTAPHDHGSESERGRGAVAGDSAVVHEQDGNTPCRQKEGRRQQPRPEVRRHEHDPAKEERRNQEGQSRRLDGDEVSNGTGGVDTG